MQEIPLMVYRYPPMQDIERCKTTPNSCTFFYPHTAALENIMTAVLTSVTKGLTKLTKPTYAYKHFTVLPYDID